ncbi:MAG TPA: hypothetical protein VME19_15160 [Streptosporangiaceae bacterium]|nr:hypothetical protein [Streptosporangiaceae bacterium]
MTVELNRTIAPAYDPRAPAQFLAGILGLAVDPPLAHFTRVTPPHGDPHPDPGPRSLMGAAVAPLRRT